MGIFTKERIPPQHLKNNIWLVKPAAANQGIFLNLGRGIQVFSSIPEIKEFLINKGSHTYWLIQKYIEKPLLYKGRKFDIRIWALITHKNEV